MSTLQERFKNVKRWELTPEEQAEPVELHGKLIADFHKAREEYFVACSYVDDMTLSASERENWRRRRRNSGRKYGTLKQQLKKLGLLNKQYGKQLRLL